MIYVYCVNDRTVWRWEDDVGVRAGELLGESGHSLVQSGRYWTTGMCSTTTPSRPRPRPVPFGVSRLSRIRIMVRV